MTASDAGRVRSSIKYALSGVGVDIDLAADNFLIDLSGLDHRLLVDKRIPAVRRYPIRAQVTPPGRRVPPRHRANGVIEKARRLAHGSAAPSEEAADPFEADGARSCRS